MAELVPASFADLVRRLYAEPRVNQSLFALPKKKWYLPDASEPDMTVRFHDSLAGNPSGTAAGPQTQMAQNLLLSYAAGGRILELKTVQINDRLTIPRPCIDMTTIGYNVEWSQELLVEQSLREYVAGMMLIEIFRRDPAFAGQSLTGAAGEVIYDMSVGYDLAGIRSEKIQRFFDGMRACHGAHRIAASANAFGIRLCP
jgi:putative selenate reductase